MKKSTVFVLFLCISVHLFSQDIASHEWKDRVLIVMTTDSIHTEFTKQLQLFEADKTGLQERRLTIYLTTPDAYRLWGASDNSWTKSDALYQQYKKSEGALEQLLIGLDGEHKNRWYRMVNALELFVTIDGMPMRQSELKNSNKQY